MNGSNMGAPVVIDWSVALPIIIVIATALVAMLADIMFRVRFVVAALASAGLALSFAACMRLWNNVSEPTFAASGLGSSAFGAVPAGQLIADNFSLFLNILILGTGILTILMSFTWLREQGIAKAEYYILLLFCMSGMMLMVQSLELITIFVALEIFSVSLYVLSAFARRKKRSSEAGLKYLLLGAFSSGFLLYGISLIYGALGTTNLIEIRNALAQGQTGYSPLLLPIGLGLIITGLAFKVSAVPFHVWTPDVYEGAPTPITAFMSVATKAAAFGVMLRILLYAFQSMEATWEPILVALSLATMIVGNLVALWQNNIKRLLAYSSIAHAGYLLIGFMASDTTGILFYLFCYAVMNLGAFAVVSFLSRTGEEFTSIDDYKGLAHKNAFASVAMSIFMFSLAGIPPAIGFYGKFLLFRNAVGAGYTGLVIVGVLTSVVSAYYYLRVVVAMWMKEPEPHVRPSAMAPGLGFSVGLLALLAVLLGLAPGRMLNTVEDAVRRESPGIASGPGGNIAAQTRLPLQP